MLSVFMSDPAFASGVRDAFHRHPRPHRARAPSRSNDRSSCVLHEREGAAVGASENIELKAADADPAASERACRALGAVDGGLLVQRDTYFAVEHGLLKLREDVARRHGRADLLPARARGRPAREQLLARARERSRRLARPAGRGARRERRRQQAPPALPAPQRAHPPRRRRGPRLLRRARERARGPGEESAAEAEALAEVVAALGLAGRETIAGGYLELSRR